MYERPPEPLVRLLAGLGLATANQLAALGRRARRLARGLPLFASVWVDAASQAGLLTPFQAAQINAGRGEDLRVGPWVLRGRLPGMGYARCFEARRTDSGHRARLALIGVTGSLPTTLAARLGDLADRATSLGEVEGLAPVEEAGVEGRRHWAACRWIEARTAGEWIVHHGRVPPEAVMRIAQRMMPALVALHRAGLCHGDLRVGTLLLADGRTEEVVLPYPGLRELVRPAEGFADADLPPEALDGLAPERIVGGQAPSVRADLFACGHLWWHLLVGRSPVLGGDGLAKLCGLSVGVLPDVRRLVSDVPERLARAIFACTAVDPADRPAAADEVAAILGEAEPAHRRRLARVLAQGSRRDTFWTRPLPLDRLARLVAMGLVALASCGLAAVAIAWSIGRGAVPIASTGLPSSASDSGQVDVGQASPETRPLAAGSQAEPDLHSSAPGATAGLPSSAGNTVGQTGRGPWRVPPGGLVVDAPGARFEGVEFLWDHTAATGSGQAAAVVRLEAAEAAFRRCVFRSRGAAAAVLWTDPADGALRPALPSGRVVLEDCVLEGVAAGVDCRRAGAIAVECRNTLVLGPGPLVRLERAPRADEPVAIRLSRATLRGSGPLLECRGVGASPAGAITIDSIESVLVSRQGQPLLLLAGEASPRALLEKLRWTGAGSVVAPAAAIAHWQPPDGPPTPLDDASISIEGLVRGEITFAREPGPDPAASQATAWQAPLRSTSPPGIDPAGLPRPSP